MIEAVEITANPVTLWEQYARSYTFGDGNGHFRRVRKVDRTKGGHWLADVEIVDEPSRLWSFFQNGLGRQVRLWSSNGRVVWGGFVNSMVLSGVTPIALTKSLDGVYTEAWVRYRDATDTFARSEISTDAYGVARYGTKQYISSGGDLASISVAASAARQIVRKRRRPKVTPARLSLGRGVKIGGRPTLEIGCKGWIWTLDWMVYNQTAASGAQAVHLEIATIAAATGQFLAGTDLAFNSVAVLRRTDADRTGLDLIMDNAALGDPYDQPWRVWVDADRYLHYNYQAPAYYLAL